MRESRALWLSFAIAVVAAMALIPLGISRARSAPSPSSGPAGPPGWTTFSPSDRAFQVFAPAGAQTSILNTSMGPAHQVDFASGA